MNDEFVFIELEKHGIVPKLLRSEFNEFMPSLLKSARPRVPVAKIREFFGETSGIHAEDGDAGDNYWTKSTAERAQLASDKVKRLLEAMSCDGLSRKQKSPRI